MIETLVPPPTRAAAVGHALSKAPEVTLGFWIVKIAATTLGETGGDWVTMSLGLGYLVGTAIFAAAFVAMVSAQIAANRLRPFLYWATIVATTTLGTTIADYCDRSLGFGYRGGVAVVFSLLVVTLAAWRLVMGRIDSSRIVTPRVEAFYWTTILFSQTLGTALGDAVADNDLGGFGLGYERGAILFGCGLAIVAALYLWTSLSRTALFWAAFVLTRPLGATVGDLLDKPVSDGGLDVSRLAASLLLLVFIVACVAILPQRPGDHAAARSSGDA